METAATEVMHKITTMKLTIAYFTTKLENFIDETNATDAELLLLLSHLTDSIQAFVLAAKVIKTNHSIDSIVDNNFLSCENIFECHACNVQTGKTYATVLNHINSKKHITHVKQFEKQKKEQVAVKNAITTIRPSSVTSPVPVALLPFPLNRQLEISPYHSIHGANSQLPALNGPFPYIQSQLSSLSQQPIVAPILTPVLARSILDISQGLPKNQIQGNAINQFGLIDGLVGGFNQLSTSESHQNYKELFKMPLPINVVGFQQNIISPSNGYLRNLDQANEENNVLPDPAPAVKKRHRQRTRRARRNKNLNNQTVEIQAKLLDERTINFLKGNYENEVVQFIKSAEKLSSYDLYTDITTNLQERCREMDFNADVECFGSRIIGIGSTKSDIDLNISVTDYNESRTTDSFLQQLLLTLSKNASWKDLMYIKSRVSLVRGHHVDMDLDCDITFNNELAMANTELIKYFYNIQPESHKLVVFVKMLTEKVKLHPQINTYTINLLVFFYFQSKGYLPKLLDLIELPTPKYWPNKFTQRTMDELNIKMNKTFHQLCLGFVDFYAHHVDFESDVLSTLTGTTIPKSLFGTPEYQATNDCYRGLLQYMEENKRAAECIRTNFRMAMCVQDPFSHDHNVSRCVGKLNLKRLRECCHETYEFLLFQSSENELS